MSEHRLSARAGPHARPLEWRHPQLKGLRTFNEFQQAGEGIASNILSDRLVRLEESGILRKEPDAADGRRFVYRLTAKGLDLAPVLVELVLWSSTYEDTDAPRATVRKMREQRARFLRRVRSQCAAP
jgi:DNA-binding HxlR family transcriptional regulator